MLLPQSSMEVHSILVGYVIMVCLGDLFTNSMFCIIFLKVHFELVCMKIQLLSYKFSVLSQTKWIV